MLQKLNNFEELCLSFKWNIPEFYNIASDTVDQDIYQNRIALINFLQDGKIEEWSFVDIKRYANKLANVFDHFHLEANARVGIILGQCPETAIAHMACFKSGKISIPLFNLFGTDALHYRLLNSRASLVICDNIGLNKIFEIKDRLPDLKKIICIDSNDEKNNVFNFKKLIEKASDSYSTKKTKASDPALIIYTSGTTGGPKGALLPHRTLLGHIPGVEIPHEFLSSSEPVTDLPELTIQTSTGSGAVLKAQISSRPEYQGEIKQVIDCISPRDGIVGYVNGEAYYGSFHIMPNGTKMTGVKHSDSDMIIYDTPQQSRTSTTTISQTNVSNTTTPSQTTTSITPQTGETDTSSQQTSGQSDPPSSNNSSGDSGSSGTGGSYSGY